MHVILGTFYLPSYFSEHDKADIVLSRAALAPPRQADEEDPNDPYVWSEDDLREHKFEKRLKPAMRMVLDLLDEDEDIHNFFEPSAYATPAQGAVAGGSGAAGDGLGAVVSQMISQQVQQAMQGNSQP
ncbi:hypothetical protein LRP88_14983 [Fusarium phalaenopsidis]